MSQCTKCGTNLIGTAANPPKDQVCHYCERDQLKQDRALLRSALAGLVGASTAAELDQMEGGIRLMRIHNKVPTEDSTFALNAIHALRATL